MNKSELAKLIRSFVDGSCGPWDWDDFTSVSHKDQEIERLRQAINEVPDKYPPGKKTHWCNEAGIEVLLGIADALSKAQ